MAGTELGKAYVQIVPSAKGISGSIQKAISPEADAAGLTAGKKISGSIGASVQNIGKGMMKAGAIATAVSVPIIAGIKKAMDAYQVQSAAETKLTEIYKTRMGATKKAAAETIKLAGALQKQGVVGDEVALSGAQQLATFAKYPGTVNALMPAMENLLVQQKGLNGTTEDATNIANLMGKVMNGQVGALKRVGISFTAAEEKVLKYGTEQERAAMLSKVITNNVGEMNKAMLATPEGKIQQMKNSLGDLAEQLGAALAPAIANIAQFVSEKIIPKVEQFMNFLQSNPAIGKVVVGITSVLAVAGPLMTTVGGLMSKIGSLKTIIGTITGPIGLIVGGFTLLYTKSESFRKAVNGLVGSIGKSLKPVLAAISSAMKQIAPVIGKIIETIASALIPIINALAPVIKAIIGIVASIAKAVIPVLVAAIKKIAPIIQGVVRVVGPMIETLFKVFSKVFNAIAKVAGPVFKKVYDFIATPIKKAKSVISSAVTAIKNFLKFTGIGKTVEKIFNTVRDKIWKPIKTAKEKISDIIDKVKKFFPINVKKLITFTLPKIGQKYKETKAKKGGSLGQYSWHVVGVTKYAKGGIFANPTLLPGLDGSRNLVGEAGPEAVLPLNTFWKELGNAMKNNSNGDININLNYDASSDASELLRDIARGVKRYRMAGVM